MAHRAAADIGFAHRADRQRRHHPRWHIEGFKGILHGKGVHHRCQHAHIVACRALHPSGRTRHTAEDVAATDDKADLYAGANDIADFAGNSGNHLRINAVGLLAHQRFTRDFQQDTWIDVPVAAAVTLAHICLLPFGSGQSPDQDSCAATSAAKSVSSFSIPSPRLKRTNAVSAMSAPASLPAFAITSPIAVSPSMTEVCSRRTTSL